MTSFPASDGLCPVRSERAQATVELVVLLPVVVVLVLAVVQLGLVARDRLLVVHAVAQAGRAVAVDPTGDAARVAALTGSALDADRVVLTVTPTGDLVRVRLTYRIPTDVPVVGALIGDVAVADELTVGIEGS